MVNHRISTVIHGCHTLIFLIFLFQLTIYEVRGEGERINADRTINRQNTSNGRNHVSVYDNSQWKITHKDGSKFIVTSVQTKLNNMYEMLSW